MSSTTSSAYVSTANGVPRVMYHGTGAAISDDFRPPSFFTERPEIAQIYACAPTRQAEGAGPNIVPVFLRILNPHAHDASVDNLSHSVLGRRGSLAQVMAELARRGHDGIHIQNYLDLGGMQDQWVIFDAAQAVSIFSEQQDSETPEHAPYERSRGG